MDPFAQTPGRMNDTFFDWPRLYAQPYDKHSVDP